jgi:hypothetical protein
MCDVRFVSWLWMRNVADHEVAADIAETGGQAAKMTPFPRKLDHVSGNVYQSSDK